LALVIGGIRLEKQFLVGAIDHVLKVGKLYPSFLRTVGQKQGAGERNVVALGFSSEVDFGYDPLQLVAYYRDCGCPGGVFFDLKLAFQFLVEADAEHDDVGQLAVFV